MAESRVTALFLDTSRQQLLDKCWPRLRACVESLTDEQVWWRPNENSNSVGNLLLHLNGNVHQWLLASFEGAEDARDRPAEFSARAGQTREAMLGALEATLGRVDALFDRLTAADLQQPMNVQGYTTTGLEAIYHVVEHFSMHYGQIAYITKLLRNENLGFYRELDATGRLPESGRS